MDSRHKLNAFLSLFFVGAAVVATKHCSMLKIFVKKKKFNKIREKKECSIDSKVRRDGDIHRDL